MGWGMRKRTISCLTINFQVTTVQRYQELLALLGTPALLLKNPTFESVAIFLPEMMGSKVRHKTANFQLYAMLAITMPIPEVGMAQILRI